mgnify:CR=1 FL=1
MANFCLMIQYDGTRYNGWQRQGNTSNTIQEKLETILEQLYGGQDILVVFRHVAARGLCVAYMHCARSPISGFRAS